MAKTLTARSIADRFQSVRWDEDSPLAIEFTTGEEAVRCRHGRFQGGRADGVEIVRVENSKMAVDVLPTRGMGIWRIESGGISYGWQSPVDGPVHPSLVPVSEPSGLGWLSGFDELLVRCGLQSNGAPEHDDHGRLLHPLHGRIANTPADGLEIEVNEASGRLDLIGNVRESRLFFGNLRLRSRLRIHAGSGLVEVLDDVTNEGSTATTVQMLYHVNVGLPCLDDGSELLAAVEELAPKDKLSADEIEQWSRYGGPEPGYNERVYFATLRSDEDHFTKTLLRNASSEHGLAVSYNTKTLPRFVLWKNTGGLEDAYVTGLEPATNYPNVRSFEESQDRVVRLEPEETLSFRVNLQPLCSAEHVAEVTEEIKKLSSDSSAKIHTSPKPGWTPGA
ncbi:MAG: aldose 1-epimerase family protein [Planctomycetota bacterium]